ncbi:hypothetical protein JEQ12_010763 [Ovis aries]|uniref:Uncharacterized protein n=1 Tax=Ovis aries TaxID=9940 RepID=A0A835ZQL2_SHEEP|nr:hypothetical protein JEQ12_010763 [Ovis aries]
MLLYRAHIDEIFSKSHNDMGGLKDDMNCDFQSFVWRRLIYSWEAKNLFGDRTSSEESLLHSIRSGNLLGARNYPARGWVDDPRTPLAANSGSLISSEMS